MRKGPECGLLAGGTGHSAGGGRWGVAWFFLACLVAAWSCWQESDPAGLQGAAAGGIALLISTMQLGFNSLPMLNIFTLELRQPSQKANLLWLASVARQENIVNI